MSQSPPYEVLIAAYRGRSLLSRAIQFRTWSPVSHISLVMAPSAFFSASPETRRIYLHQAAMIDAWKRGVRRVDGILAGHDRKTAVTLYRVSAPFPDLIDHAAVWSFASDQVGRPYDYLGVLGFCARADRLHSRRRWFCSELAAACFARAGLHLLSPAIPHHRIYPGMVTASPRLSPLDDSGQHSRAGLPHSPPVAS